MKITEEKYNSLDLKGKIWLLYKEGSFLMAIRYYEYRIDLYILNGFYVEVFFHYQSDKIEKIEVMDKNHSRIKFYADQIRLPGL